MLVGDEYFALLCREGGSIQAFQEACRGGVISNAAVEVVKSIETAGHRKNLLQKTLPARILALISE